MKRRFLLTFEEFFRDISGCLDILKDTTCKSKGSYELKVALMPLDFDLDLNASSEDSLCCFVFNIVDSESSNIEVLEGVYLKIRSELSNFEFWNGGLIANKKDGFLYSNGIYFCITKLD